jgi:hypothetical protein
MSYWKALSSWLWKAILGILAFLGAMEGLKKLAHVTGAIPDWALLGLILLTLAIAFHSAIWINRYNQDLIFPRTKRAPRLKPTLGHMFILAALANSPDRRAKRGLLFAGFHAVFAEKGTDDFNFVFSQLQDRDYFGTCGTDVSADCVITSDGLEFYEGHKSEFMKSGGIPSVPEEIWESYRMAQQF